MHPAFLVLSAIAMLVVGCRCSLASPGTGKEVHIVSYNVHNLFDAEESGKEYPEFRPSKGAWSKELYAKRLANTVEAIRSLSGTGGPRGSRDPDILCLQEIENINVLSDLAAHFDKGSYRYWAMSGPNESIIHSGLLSRFPIVTVHTHSVVDAWGFGPMRDILEVEIDLGSAGKILVFVCHWKSKSEGEAQTEACRRAAAALLVQRIREVQAERPSLPIVVCGDFNESPDEYLRVGRAYPTAIMPSELSVPPSVVEGEPLYVCGVWDGLGSAEKLALYNPWAENPGGFSFVFRDTREQFDSFFLSAALHDGEDLEYERFSVADTPMLFDVNGRPQEWKGSAGYSDHLPVELTLSVRGGR